jgi:hypothetical protein
MSRLDNEWIIRQTANDVTIDYSLTNCFLDGMTCQEEVSRRNWASYPAPRVLQELREGIARKCDWVREFLRGVRGKCEGTFFLHELRLAIQPQPNLRGRRLPLQTHHTTAASAADDDDAILANEVRKRVRGKCEEGASQGLLPECREDSGRYRVNFLGSRSTRVGIGYFGEECLATG